MPKLQSLTPHPMERRTRTRTTEPYRSAAGLSKSRSTSDAGGNTKSRTALEKSPSYATFDKHTVEVVAAMERKSPDQHTTGNPRDSQKMNVSTDALDNMDKTPVRDQPRTPSAPVRTLVFDSPPSKPTQPGSRGKDSGGNGSSSGGSALFVGGYNFSISDSASGPCTRARQLLRDRFNANSNMSAKSAAGGGGKCMPGGDHNESTPSKCVVNMSSWSSTRLPNSNVYFQTRNSDLLPFASFDDAPISDSATPHSGGDAQSFAEWSDSDDDEPAPLHPGESPHCCNCKKELAPSTQVYECRDGRRRWFCQACPSPRKGLRVAKR